MAVVLGFLGVLIGAGAGVFAGMWLATTKARGQQLQREIEQQRVDAVVTGTLRGELATQTTLAAERLSAMTALRADLDQLRTELQAATATELRLSEENSQLRTTLAKERESGLEKLELLTKARAELTSQFEALAGKILEEKSTRFTEQNKANLDQLLGPLRTQITEFKGKVEEAQKDSLAGRVELRGKLESLEKLNQQLTAEAHNLTTALRGSSKVQGDWGEFILRDLLDKAGLREGEQYRFQESFGAEEDENGVRGKASRTDVIVNLPGGRHLIVDSKVSLNAYTDYANAAADELRKIALKQHLVSVRAHLDGLSKRSYHKLKGLDSPDFVVMFIPIEPAFLLAMQEGGEMWREAYERNVIMVGPTTLLFVIRIVDNLWQQEQQARNVEEVVDRGTKLYEKFVLFVEDLTKVGDCIRTADQNYQKAIGKLSTGPGNLIRQTELLKKAGIRTNKQLPVKLLDAAGVDAEEQAELSLAAAAEDTFQLN
jgi:DNA recombination protein RmuC